GSREPPPRISEALRVGIDPHHGSRAGRRQPGAAIAGAAPEIEHPLPGGVSRGEGVHRRERLKEVVRHLRRDTAPRRQPVPHPAPGIESFLQEERRHGAYASTEPARECGDRRIRLPPWDGQNAERYGSDEILARPRYWARGAHPMRSLPALLQAPRRAAR